VDDYAPFRQWVRSLFQKLPHLQVIGEVSDGPEAVQKARELWPDLILLDIGLPTLNGIEAARRIRELSPTSKILFVSENRSWDRAKVALDSGASGYVVKSDAGSDLLPAIESVLQDKQFVSAGLAGHDLTDFSHVHPLDSHYQLKAGRHEAGFYSDDRRFLEDAAQFIGSALKAGNAAIVAATESHRNSLLSNLSGYGLDIGSAIEQGRYIALDAADVLSTFMRNGVPDPYLFMRAFGEVVLAAIAKAQHQRVAIFGESAHLLWAGGNAEAAINMEKLGNQLVSTYNVDILCGYSLDRVSDMIDDHIYQRICAEHSAVHSQ
jgi:CheY-like chemotaxis protein